ncbi:DNA-directed RNA polymerase III subunit C37 TDEL_0H01290 [Torulaspora delbrueckii]|uniref:DNA-directed RNA polymerase III subunit RPC5 n=1 Tax=Torulaspora delbrueckii TaxID=4950 RepID=G8ZZE4_TORDE|nr:hypothetical protein TDEL_0H01290 [Torulaspora delbrueckii]CCE93988.1 hypothetical protein TDEL_0H01290 [Torulaspora delbrueckii]
MSSENQLFVTDEDDKVQDDEVMDESENIVPQAKSEETYIDDEEDPVIQEFPLNVAGRDETLHILQYANKPKKMGGKAADHPLIGAARYKPNSSVWELDVPVDEAAFYNKSRAEENWGEANIQTLRGVGVENEGQYAGFVSNGQIYLLSVEKVAQLRPFFKYIDKVSTERKQDDAKRNANPASQKSQVVTMSVRSVNDQTQNRLAGSLLAHKVADEEEATEMSWVENTFEAFKESVVADAAAHVLQPVGDAKEYEEYS